MPSISERLLFEPREYTAPEQVHTLSKFAPVLQPIPKKASYSKEHVTNKETAYDPIFWAIKLWLEMRIKEQGEGRIVPYSLLESWAFSMFEDRAKDKSTLRAKCRDTWQWYDDRSWTNTSWYIYEKKDEGEVMATRQAHIAKVNQNRKLKSKLAIKTVLEDMFAREQIRYQNGKLKVNAIAELTGISSKTVGKYLKDMGLK